MTPNEWQSDYAETLVTLGILPDVCQDLAMEALIASPGEISGNPTVSAKLWWNHRWDAHTITASTTGAMCNYG